MRKHIQLILCLQFVLVLSSSSFPQQDYNDPQYDRIPYELLNLPPQTDLLTPDIITINGFDNFDLGTDFAEPHIAGNPNDPLQYFTAFNTNGAHRTYDGLSWISSTPSFGTSVSGDPVTAYDSLGNLYYENMYGSIVGCKILRSTDNGLTWSSPVTSIAGVDKNWLAADQTGGPYANYVYSTMTASGTEVNFTRSTDLGATWTNTRIFTVSSTLPGSTVTVGPNDSSGTDIPGGSVYVMTNSGSATASTYTLYRSTDGGATFMLMSTNVFANYVGTLINSRNSVQNMRTRPYPFIAADNSYGPFRGRLYLVYASNTPAGNGNKPDIFCRYSIDYGATWSSPVVINDDANTQSNNQWHPSIWCDKETGRLYAHWMDTRDTPTSDSAMIYASYSDNGGITFAPNQQLSNKKMKINCASCGGGGTPRYQGDYDAVVSNGNVSMNVWTDFRSNTFGSYTAYFPDFALTVDSASLAIHQGESGVVTIAVPAVKLYDDTVSFSAVVSPLPTSGNIDFAFAQNNINTFPASSEMTISVSPGVPVGVYTVNIFGKGPQGIPVHKRSVTVTVDLGVPVELTAFTGRADNDKVTLNWRTATETNNKGFEIERALFRQGAELEYTKVGFVNGSGTVTSPVSYMYEDKGITSPGKYYYRLKQVDFDGSFEYSNLVEAEVLKPLSYSLMQNYPNPFNPVTTIRYSIPFESRVTVKIYDALGNLVSEVINQVQPVSNYQVRWDAGSVSSGIYFYKLEASSLDGSQYFTDVKKMMLIK